MRVRRIQFLSRLLLLFLTALAVLNLCGCATNDAENASARPWNSPRGWEYGLPPGLYEGR
jgi:hypothetical protein